MRLLVASLVAALLLTTALRAQSPLQTALKDTDIAPHWIYDDFAQAKAQAQESKKPLLVVLRCVPCPPGRTLDRALLQPDQELKKLEDQFVCVRIVQTNGLDLRQFQVDFDNSWSAVFMNADGTIYGRFGTRTATGQQSDWFHNVPAFRKTMERALVVHQGYPANRASLVDKMPKKLEWDAPEQIPSLASFGSRATTAKSCIHCHMVREHMVRTKWQENKLALSDLQVFPMPDNIGLHMDDKDGLKIQSVTPESPAAAAGLKSGDELVRLNGQPLLSIADIQWVLHNVPSETTLKATVQRNDKMLEKELALRGNWKASDIAWRASSWYGLRQGLKTESLKPGEKKERGIAEEELALNVVGLFGKGAPLLQKAGLRKGDIIVAMDGKTEAMTESQFLIALRLNHGPADSVRFTVLRGNKREELSIPMW